MLYPKIYTYKYLLSNYNLERSFFMKLINITDVKTFMSCILIKDMFDNFLLEDASITTYNTFNIDGHIVKSYFTDEEYENIPQELSYWHSMKPICYDLIKGKKTPVKFKFILKADSKLTASLLEENSLSFSLNDIGGLYINIRYENNTLDCISATNLNLFTLDKSLENVWDEYVKKFLGPLS